MFQGIKGYFRTVEDLENYGGSSVFFLVIGCLRLIFIFSLELYHSSDKIRSVFYCFSLGRDGFGNEQVPLGFRRVL